VRGLACVRGERRAVLGFSDTYRATIITKMSPQSARLDRALIAASVGLVIALVVALFAEKSPSAAINRGDFPAFYTLARIASSSEPHRLYDLKLQTDVQNEVWPTFEGGVLPAAYPAYVAFFCETSRVP